MHRLESKTPSPQLAWIDVSKGIGILLVVLGHTQTGTLAQRFAYLFHMPLFFFLSGYLHKTQISHWQYFKKKAIHLLLPYLSFLVLLAPFQSRFDVTHATGPHAVRRQIFNIAWGGCHLHGLVGVFWFLSCLFALQQFMTFVISKLRPRNVLILGGAFLLLSYAGSVYSPNIDLPLALQIVPAAIPFFVAGHFMARVRNQPALLLFASALGTIVALLLSWKGDGISYDMKHMNYGVPFLSFVLSLCCIVTLAKISEWISSVVILKTTLSSFGKMSIGIMSTHIAFMAIPFLKLGSAANCWVRFSLVAAGAYGITFFFAKFPVTRALFLGSEKDCWYLWDLIATRVPEPSTRVAEIEDPADELETSFAARGTESLHDA